MAKLNTLTTERATVKLRQMDTRVIKIRRFKEYENKEFKDFVVDGVSVRGLILKEDSDANDMSTGLQSDFTKIWKKEYASRLLGKAPADLQSGRVALYVCPFDGDPACLAVGCRIDFDKSTVKWHDFAWDNYTSDQFNEHLVDTEDDNNPIIPLKNIASFTFDRREYEELLEGLVVDLDNKLRK